MNNLSLKLQQTLKKLSSSSINIFKHNLRGIEKESLRIDFAGKISNDAHPQSLGSALKNPYITTDYAEALLELVTEPKSSIKEALAQLKAIHQFIYKNLINEILWPLSMPPDLDGSEVAIAQYGSSNLATMKTLYRKGLTLRYGTNMQLIAGIHYNFSLDDNCWQYSPACSHLHNNNHTAQQIKNHGYLALCRNFSRFGIILPYLFGASNAISRGYLEDLKPTPYATALRMSSIGYQNNKHDELAITFNSLQNYIKTIQHAVLTPDADFVNIGLKHNGAYQQISCNILQIENEYYHPIRPKGVFVSQRPPLVGLAISGINYLEIRMLDLNPYTPVGISEEQAYFMEVLLITCALLESPAVSPAELAQNSDNLQQVATQGLAPRLTVYFAGAKIFLHDFVAQVLQLMLQVANSVTQLTQDQNYLNSVQQQIANLEQQQTMPQRLAKEYIHNQKGVTAWGLQQAIKNAKELTENDKLSPELLQHFKNIAQDSLAAVQEFEQQPQCEFSQYLHDYFTKISRL